MMSPRIRRNLNREWKFCRGDVAGAEQIQFDDSSWQPIGLPHTFDLPYFRTPEFYVGYGWYRKTFELGKPGSRRAFLEFGGVFQVAEVFVNGTRVGEHRGGYTAFSIEITTALRPGANVIAVRVNNLWDPRLAPRAGEHIFSGGIYRDVHLLITDQLRFVANGTVVTTSLVAGDSARVLVRTEIEGDDGASARVRITIIDPRGKVVATADDAAFDRIVSNPQLWHPDHPHLYQLQQELFVGDTLVDLVTTRFGIRSVEWTADRGFFLNGEHVYLRGANVHQDRAGWGIASTRAGCERDVRLIKEAGFNFIRGAHYPHHRAFAEACDRLGVLFWSELAFWGKGGFGPEGYWNASAYPTSEADFAPFEESCRQQLREMIEQNHNSPSVIAWSVSNEAFFTYNLDRARALISDLVKLSHQLDPTRPAAVGGAQRGNVDTIGDVAGYNGDGARLFINPGVPNMVSEYGAISKPHDAYEPFWGELQPEQFDWRAGQAIWAGFDYGSIAGKQGLKGIINHFRLPKRSWYWYRNEYRGIAPPPAPREGVPAMLRLDADKTTIIGTDATDDCQLIVTACDAAGTHVSNSPPITMTIESGPGELPTGPSITFDASTDIQIVSGQAAIEFRSYHAGKTLIRATSPGLQDATITITTTGEPAFISGITPPAPSRPYTPPPPSQASIYAMKNAVNVARDRPCRASSERSNHPARFANDGNDQSLWIAAAADTSAWWHVDLEGFYQISGGRLVFERDGNYRYAISVSNDATNWTMAIDRSQTTNSNRIRDEIYPVGATARYVRITFVSVPASARAALAEFEVHGILSVR